jgi:hypothetical protein
MKHTRIVALTLTCIALGACNSDAALGPRDEHATMRVGASGVTASAIGQIVVIAASVMDADGAPMRDADIHWDVSSAGVLESLGDGRFRVVREGSVDVAAVWPKDPSVRATVSVTVDAGLLASACISKSDQSTTLTSKCANARVVVRVASSASSSVAPLDGPAVIAMPFISRSSR